MAMRAPSPCPDLCQISLQSSARLLNSIFLTFGPISDTTLVQFQGKSDRGGSSGGIHTAPRAIDLRNNGCLLAFQGRSVVGEEPTDDLTPTVHST